MEFRTIISVLYKTIKYVTNMSFLFFAAMRKTERLESEHASKRNSVIASEHRLSHVSVSKLLRRGHTGAVRIGRPQVLQHILVRDRRRFAQ